MEFLDKLFFRGNLKRNTPPDLWYYDSSDGITMVAHARFVDIKRKEMRDKRGESRSLIQPGRLQIYEPRAQEQGLILFFSDRTELREPGGKRGCGLAVGRMKEFPHFWHEIRIEHYGLEIPKLDRIGICGGPDFGTWAELNDLHHVIAHAHAIGLKSV